MKSKIKYILLIFIFSICAFPLIAQEKVYPKNGEGIILLLKRFNRSGSYYEHQFIELNKNKLGKNNTLKKGVAYVLPPFRKDIPSTKNTKNIVGSKGYQPLFGKELANYQISSSELKNATFYLVSGHGGPDPGAIGKIGKIELHEDEYAYDIILRLARNLLCHGAKVHIIIQDAKDGIRNDRYLSNSKRETCMGNSIPTDQTKRLQQRCYTINQLFKQDHSPYKRAIFIHVDSRNKGKQIDVFFYHQDKNSESKYLAKSMKSTFTNKYKRHQPGRGFRGTISKRNLYVLKNTTPASVFVEVGNIQNSFDLQRLLPYDNRQALANWLCEGFINDYNRYKKKVK